MNPKAKGEEEMESTERASCERLRRAVLPYLRQARSKTELEIALLPRVMAEMEPFPQGSYNTKLDRIRINVPSLETDVGVVLATLAHEIGHAEQHKAGMKYYELDAWRRGLVWAEKWTIIPQYREAVRNSLRIYEGWGREPNIIRGLRKLLEEIS